MDNQRDSWRTDEHLVDMLIDYHSGTLPFGSAAAIREAALKDPYLAEASYKVQELNNLFDQWNIRTHAHADYRELFPSYQATNPVVLEEHGYCPQDINTPEAFATYLDGLPQNRRNMLIEIISPSSSS